MELISALDWQLVLAAAQRLPVKIKLTVVGPGCSAITCQARLSGQQCAPDNLTAISLGGGKHHHHHSRSNDPPQHG